MSKFNRTVLARAMAQIMETREHAGVPRAIPGRIELLAAAAATSAELYVYGDIGDSWWDESITASQVVEQLNALDPGVTTLDVYINSYGGSVTDGLAIYNALKRKARAGVTVNTHVDGIAASIASLIAMAGGTVAMASNTRMMVHAPWGGLYVTGNANDVREAAAEFASVLDGYADAMAASYASKTGKPHDEMLALLTDGVDHWYSAAEAKAAGLCDVISDAPEDEEAAASATATLVAQPAFARYLERMPTQLAAALRPAAAPARTTTPSPAHASVTQPATPGVIPEESVMTEEEKRAAHVAAQKAARTALQARNVEFKAMAEPHFGNTAVRKLYDDTIADVETEVSAAEFGAKVLAVLAKDRGPIAGSAFITVDERDNRQAGMAAALQARLGQKPDKDRAVHANAYRGFSLYDMARECAAAAGVAVRGMSKDDIVRAAITHTSSDFPQLLGNQVRLSALRGYEEYPEVFPEFTRPISVPDFRKESLAGLGNYTGVEEVPEGGEYKYGTFTDIGQEVQLKKMGSIFSITDEAVINDRIGLLDTVPAKMSAATKRALGDRVFALLTANPVLADGVQLFHATHNNLMAGAAPTTAVIDAMIAKMALQKDAKGNPVRAPLKFVLVPVGLGGTVRTILESQYEVGAGAARNNTTPNIVRNRFVVIEDPRLDANSPTAFYGVADPAVIDAIVIAYRDGVQQPRVTQKEGWNIDGIEFKVRLDAAPALADYMGVNKNPGA